MTDGATEATPPPVIDAALLRAEGLSNWAADVVPHHLDLGLAAGIDLQEGWEARAMARYGVTTNIQVGAEAYAGQGPGGFDAGALATLTAHF